MGVVWRLVLLSYSLLVYRKSPGSSRVPNASQIVGLGERCDLPQRGVGRSPSRNRVWCILALKSGSWWQQF